VAVFHFIHILFTFLRTSFSLLLCVYNKIIPNISVFFAFCCRFVSFIFLVFV